MRGEEVGESHEVFCLGLVLHLILTGRHPFESDPKTPEHKRSEVVRKAVIAGELNLAKLPEGPTDLLRKMLAAKPEQRIALADILKHRWLFVGTFGRRPTLMNIEVPSPDAVLSRILPRSNTLGNLTQLEKKPDVQPRTSRLLEKNEGQTDEVGQGEKWSSSPLEQQSRLEKSKSEKVFQFGIQKDASPAMTPPASFSPRAVERILDDSFVKKDLADSVRELGNDPFGRQSDYLVMNLDSSIVDGDTPLSSSHHPDSLSSSQIRNPPSTYMRTSLDIRAKLASETLARALSPTPPPASFASPNNSVIKRFEATLAKIDSEITELKAPRPAQHSDRLRELAIENEQLKLEIARLKKPEDSLAPLLARLETVEKENRKLQAQVIELEKELAEKRADIGLSEEQLILVKLERDIIDSQRYDKLLNQEIDGLVSFLRNPATDENAIIESIKKAALAKRSAVQPLIDTTNDLLGKLTPEILKMNHEIDDFEEKVINRVNEDIAGVTSKLVQLEIKDGELKRLRNDMEELEQKVFESNRLLKEQESENIGLQEQIKAKEMEMESGAEAIISLKKKVDMLQGELLIRRHLKK